MNGVTLLRLPPATIPLKKIEFFYIAILLYTVIFICIPIIFQIKI